MERSELLLPEVSATTQKEVVRLRKAGDVTKLMELGLTIPGSVSAADMKSAETAAIRRGMPSAGVIIG